MDKSKFKTTIRHCARCDKDHKGLEFTKFTSPIEDTDKTIWTYFALCPTNQEPILLKVKDNG